MQGLVRRWVRLLCTLSAVVALAACQVELHSGLEETEANEIMGLLLTNGISASKEVDTRSGLATVKIQERDFSSAVQILKQEGLPRERFATVDQIFGNGGLVSSPTEEQAILTYSISQALSQTISELDGILSARVHIVLPQNDLINQLAPTGEEAKARASVVIRRREDINLDNFVPRLKHFVSSSVDGLEYNDVAVIDFVVPASGVGTPDTAEQALGTSGQGAGFSLLVMLGGAVIAGMVILGLALPQIRESLLARLPVSLFGRGIDRSRANDLKASGTAGRGGSSSDDFSVPERKIVTLADRSGGA
ncbi:type III secretion inner membrane ring lipoprotein SctJ [Flavimaricola sp.]|nr:type III secretion inner membrane ring lipoprotein SctJ [Flavimaricola sp.]MDA9019997.1 type III secretion inner membrane ring lipoprotein SctJ [Flavimaricola sp.]